MNESTGTPTAPQGRNNLALGLWLAYVALTVYWAMTPAGPGLWLAKGQAAVMGGMYSAKFSALLLNLVPFVLLSFTGGRGARDRERA